MTPTVIAISNQSTKVTDDQVQAAISAIGIQLARDVAPIWGLVPSLVFVPPNADLAGECSCVISDTPDQPGALGYHDEGSDGVPYIKVFVIDGYDWVTTLSHEILELTGNPAANRWADSPDGSDYAQELCDAVEGDTYAINGLNVSNFVYPAFFDPNAQKGEKLDYLGKLSAPFTMTPGGYEIHRTEPGQVAQVFAARATEGRSAAQVGAQIVLIFGKDYPEALKPSRITRAMKFDKRSLVPKLQSQVDNAMKVGISLDTKPAATANVSLQDVLRWAQDVPPQWRTHRLGEMFRRMVVDSITKNWPR